MLDPGQLTRALTVLGGLLAERGHRYEIVAIGASALMLLGLVTRPTRDVDIVAIVGPEGYAKPRPLPEPLATAVGDVAATLGLSANWLNAGPADLLDFGLPQGFAERVVTRAYASLIVHVAGRFDQICFKLYAAVDQGPNSRHFADLRQLEPTHAEIVEAARWTRTHDPSEGFRAWLVQALGALGIEDADAKV